ncbi:hypothetical protein QQP08_012317 [Theobroma cacao]|nr:hypothetical protein QQP08_012317 [Theobroma cacao]
MFVLKTTIEENMLEHIRDSKIPKKTWDTLATIFSKKNDTRLQLLENELLLVAQSDMTITQYFHKVKSIRHEISELDSITPIDPNTEALLLLYRDGQINHHLLSLKTCSPVKKPWLSKYDESHLRVRKKHFMPTKTKVTSSSARWWI